MPRPKPPAFDAVSIGKEVNRGRVKAGLSVPQVVELLQAATGKKWTRPYWYKKVEGSPPFSLDELGVLAANFDADPGWPLIPWGLKPDERGGP